jgi:hypothetical protein
MLSGFRCYENMDCGLLAYTSEDEGSAFLQKDGLHQKRLHSDTNQETAVLGFSFLRNLNRLFKRSYPRD